MNMLLTGLRLSMIVVPVAVVAAFGVVQRSMPDPLLARILTRELALDSSSHHTRSIFTPMRMTETSGTLLDAALQTTPIPTILPADKPLNSTTTTTNNNINNKDEFSILSWNILLPNSRPDNYWNHKMYASWVPMEKREWSHRHALIKQRLELAGADVVCIQEADGDTFEEDFAFMAAAGYESCLHNKFRFRCATFFKSDKFTLEREAHKDRTLVTALRTIGREQGADANCSDRVLNVVNCHLSGGAAPDRRVRQVFEALDQIRKWNTKAETTADKLRKAKRPSPKNIKKAEEESRRHSEAGVLVCGDFNSDGNTGVRRLLVEGSVNPEWREPQYPNVPLTSKRKEQPLGEHKLFLDAAEMAYASNVCDGDYGEDPALSGTCRPPTYVVPNLASLLLHPVAGEGDVRTEFGPQVAQGLADTLGLRDYCENEIDTAFDSIDLDGNNKIDEDEVQALLESVYVATYGRQIEDARNEFFSNFRDDSTLSLDQFTEKLMSLQQKIEKGNSGEGVDRKVARGLADTLGLRAFSNTEIARAFDSIDLDGNNQIDEDEIQTLLETVFVATYGEKIEKERKQFYAGFIQDSSGTIISEEVYTAATAGLSREQFTDRLLALQQELEGGSEGSELMEVRTEMDARRMISRFTPLLKGALDQVFDDFSSDGGETLTEDEINSFLIKANGSLGRGMSQDNIDAVLQRKVEASQPLNITRQEWHGIFARELGEGKWWQVVYDLEVCGANIRSSAKSEGRHYQAWLDYVYFDSDRLACTCVQEALTTDGQSRIYKEGDALPNKWHPSDHLPVAAKFSWQGN